jgi:hypothetical protein
MKIALFVFAGIIAVACAYHLLFPSGTVFIVSGPGKRTIAFAKEGITLEAAPDHYAKNGSDHLQPYIARLLTPSGHFRSMSLFSPDGNRGFLFTANGVVKAGLTVEWRKEAERERRIRSFFSSQEIAPSADYLAGNDGVPDATRILEYPISGNTLDVTALTKRILEELCEIKPSEALDIAYREK